VLPLQWEGLRLAAGHAELRPASEWPGVAPNVVVVHVLAAVGASPTWLRDAGYYNVHIGKYMNGYGGGVPPGWNEWYGKLSEYNTAVYGAGIYYNFSMWEDPPVSGGRPCPSGRPGPPGQAHTCSYGGL
jgi:hypothetical protein